ncbi:MAG: hypothetical protein QOE61_649, partial [Micromonosporaceae bacterium]|nr:hypothetical protein [Micromonosporaceae bacterium]
QTEVGVRTTDYTYPAPTAAHPHFVTNTTVTGSAGTNATAEYQVDAMGNTTGRPTAKNGQQTLTWSAEGQLATVKDNTGTSSYVYDADGNRLITKDPAGKTLYLPGQELRVNNDGAVQSCTRYYSYGGKTVAQRTAAGLTWLVSDTQNTASISVDALTQQATVRHLTPYGDSRDGASTWVNDKGFLGKTIDKTGLTHVGAREYDAAQGRFLSVDPVMDVSDPQQMQGYAYASNNPITFSDPDGRMMKADNGGGGGYVPPAPTGGGGATTGGGGGGRERQSGDHQQDKCSHSWWCKTKSWVSDHKADIAGFVAGAVVGVGCEAAIGWTGVGAVACGFAAGAVGSVVHDMVEGGHSVGDMAGDAVIGGFIGGVTGGVFSVAGRALSAGVRSLVSGEGAQVARQAAVGAGKTEAKNISSGLAKAVGKGCTHSFAAGTLVLMADGSTKAIGKVADGDEVLSSDPATGMTNGKKVVDLHKNRDTDLTDLTITTSDGKTATLNTTQHHPFWSVSRGDWIDAADLVSGELLHAADGKTIVAVTKVKSFTGHHTMRDLTIEHVHTYYVLAGNTPVLVHNCGGGFKAGIGADEVNDINRSFGGQTTLNGSFDNTMINASRYNSFYDKSAVVIRDIAGGHMFDNGNKRTSQAVVEQLMQRNNVISGPTSAELRGLIDSVGKGKLSSVEDISRALRGY